MRVGNTTRILAVRKDRKKETVKTFFSRIPTRGRKTVRVVCSDMYDGFINAAKEVCGDKVKIIIDRFHVAKWYRKGVDTLRKAEMKRLKNTLVKEEYAKLKNVTYGSPIFKAVQQKWYKALCRALTKSPKSPEYAVGEGSEPSHIDRSAGVP